MISAKSVKTVLLYLLTRYFLRVQKHCVTAGYAAADDAGNQTFSMPIVLYGIEPSNRKRI